MRKKDKIYEEYLATAARMGDRRAIDALVRYRSPRLYSHAYRLLGDRDDAMDAVQDAWIEILRGLPQLIEPRAFPAWAYQITTRRCARLIDKNIKQRALGENPDPAMIPESPEPGPAAADANTIRAAINTLPHDHAATLKLFYIDEMSVREVAFALDIPVGTVKSRLMHARQKLKQTLKGNQNG